MTGTHRAASGTSSLVFIDDVTTDRNNKTD